MVEGDQKDPFSIATTLRCRGGHYSFPWIAPLYPWYVPLYCWVLSKEVSSTIFKIFDMMRPGIEPQSPGPLVNIQPARPICRLTVCKIFVLDRKAWYHVTVYKQIIDKKKDAVEHWK